MARPLSLFVGCLTRSATQSRPTGLGSIRVRSVAQPDPLTGLSDG